MVQQYVPNQQNQLQTNVLCVDVRTGAKIFEGRFEGPSHTFATSSATCRELDHRPRCSSGP